MAVVFTVVLFGWKRNKDCPTVWPLSEAMGGSRKGRGWWLLSVLTLGDPVLVVEGEGSCSGFWANRCAGTETRYGSSVSCLCKHSNDRRLRL